MFAPIRPEPDLANAFGIVSQTRAVHELAAAGLPAALANHAGALIDAGRIFQLVAVPAQERSKGHHLGRRIAAVASARSRVSLNL